MDQRAGAGHDRQLFDRDSTFHAPFLVHAHISSYGTPTQLDFSRLFPRQVYRNWINSLGLATTVNSLIEIRLFTPLSACICHIPAPLPSPDVTCQAPFLHISSYGTPTQLDFSRPFPPQVYRNWINSLGLATTVNSLTEI